MQRVVSSFALIGLAAWSVPASAQSPAASDTTAPNGAAWQLGPFVGGARHSPITSNLGATPGRDHLFVGVEAVTSMVRLGALQLRYAAQVLPLVVITGRTVPLGYRGPRAPDGLLPTPDRVYATGLSPFGLELATPLEHRLSVFAATSAGALLFTRPFPVPEARRLNFTLEYGGGVRLRTTRTAWVRVGYKHHHLSNAYTALMNPGLDARVVYVGYEWTVRLPR